jgi:autotransporter-associated beta strand protein
LSPLKLRHAYGIDNITLSGNVMGDGTSQTIAIVDAFDNPNIASDLQAFDAYYGLPNPTFTKLAQDGSKNYPGVDPQGGWEAEVALDVEYSHAIAPKANILLVEANDNSFSNLNAAVDFARGYTGVVAVSMSYGGSEFSGETAYDFHFTTPNGHAGVTFLSSSGDSGAPPSYQAASPNVVAVGGTVLTVDSNGNYVSESGWSGSGGGISTQEPEPAYQNGVQSTGSRTNPDVSIIGGTAVSVYDSYNNGTAAPWEGLYGTSLSSPCWAGLIAIADQGRSLLTLGSLDGPTQTLPALYGLPASDYHDITTGNNGYPAGPGYDYVTGIGTPIANLLVPDLAKYGQAQTGTLTWSGAGPDAKWSDGQNWVGGKAPIAGDTLVFGPGASQLTNTNDFAAGTSFTTIRFTSAGYTIGGNSLTLSGGIDGTNATGGNTFNPAITLSANGAFNLGTNGASLTVGGAINDAGFAIQVAGTNGTLTLGGVVSGAGSITDGSPGTLILSGSSTYSGGTTLNAGGVLALGNNSALGTGALTLTAGTVESNGSAVAAANAVNLSGNLTIGGSSNLSFAGAATLTGNTTLTVAKNVTATLSGGVGQSGGTWALSKSGSGTLVLSAAGTYAGGTTDSAGTLAVGNNTALGTGTLTLNTNATIQANGGAVSLGNAITLAGNASIAGTNNLTFTGAITLTGKRTLSVTNTGTTTISGAIGQSGGSWSLTKQSAGVLVLSGANTYAGGTVLSGGILAVTGPGSAGTGTLSLNGGNIEAFGGAVSLANPVTLGGTVGLAGSNNLTFTGAATLTGNRTLSVSNTGTTTFAGGIGQSGGTWALTMLGSGLLVLPAADSYAGGTTLGGGTLQLGDPGALGTGTLKFTGGNIKGSGTALTFGNPITLGGNLTVAGNSDLTFTGAATLTGTRTVTVTNTGTTTFGGAIGQSGGTWGLTKKGAGLLVLNGANTYGGTTSLSAGTLAAGSAGALGTGTLALNGGTIQASGGPIALANPVTLGGNVTVGGTNDLTFTGAATLTGSRTLTITNTGTTTFAGAIGQSGGTWSLTKAGAGLLVLNGNNTYGGGTTVSAGTLGGSGTLGAVTVKSGAALYPGSSAANTAILTTGNVTFNSGSAFDVALNGTSPGAGGYDQLNVNGTVSLGGCALNLTFGAGFTPAVGTVFTLINNNGVGAVSGTFQNLPEGATIVINGMTFQISYKGGDGNDVTLTRTA